MILSCSNIQKAFGSTEILKNITFKIENNEKLAIVGVNGAGKTTLMRILTGEESYDYAEGDFTIKVALNLRDILDYSAVFSALSLFFLASFSRLVCSYLYLP